MAPNKIVKIDPASCGHFINPLRWEKKLEAALCMKQDKKISNIQDVSKELIKDQKVCEKSKLVLSRRKARLLTDKEFKQERKVEMKAKQKYQKQKHLKKVPDTSDKITKEDTGNCNSPKVVISETQRRKIQIIQQRYMWMEVLACLRAKTKLKPDLISKLKKK